MATTIGWFVTGIWVFVSAVYLKNNFEIFKSMSPNAWGDAAAGFAAPLAFLWLVIGYYLQRTELSLQRDEIKLQREELAAQRAEMEKQSNSISLNEQHASRDVFLKVYDIVFDGLNNKALEILEIIHGGAASVGLKNFIDGNKWAIFNTLNPRIKNSESIKKQLIHFEHEPRKTVLTSYCEMFEVLISESENCDSSGLFKRTILDQPMARTYFAIAKFQDRYIPFKPN